MKPEIIKGTRDFLPLEMAKREYVLQKIKSVFKIFGYDAVETPAIEYAKTILGKYGDEGERLTYTFQDKGGRNLALRYDQTVPFARLFAANYKSLPIPFKRYQIGRVWRGDRPGKGRYREFYQCDIDIIGTTNLVAETEIAKVAYKVFESLGFQNYKIKFNNRRLLNSILDSLFISKNKQTSVIRVLDKLEKIGAEEVIKELEEFIDLETSKKLLQIIQVKGSNNEKVDRLKRFDIKELQKFIELCQTSSIEDKFLDFDPSLARGLDYYTGIIYEVFLKDLNMGAVCAGGRYDDLCSMFTKEKFSGVGVAFGFERIALAMDELGMLKDIKLNANVLVTYFDDNTIDASLELSNELRKAGVNTEIYFEPAKLGKQLGYADKKGISFVVICGPDEVKNDEVKIKIMKTGKEKTLPKNQLTNYLLGFYEGKK